MAESPYFEQAADALRRAMKATNLGEQALLLEEAVRLNRQALAQEKERLDGIGSDPPPASERQAAAPSPPSPPLPKTA